MKKGIQITRGQIVLLLLSVLLSAFLGITAGNYFLQLRTEKANTPGGNLLLKAGQVFPEYRFAGLSSEQPDVFLNLEGRKSILIFLTTDCGHCIQVINWWDSLYPSISHKYQVAGISFEPIDKLKAYKADKGVKFPLYNDPNGKFTGQYKMDSYPTIFGVNEKREIVFVKFGNRPKKSAEEYLGLL